MGVASTEDLVLAAIASESDLSEAESAEGPSLSRLMEIVSGGGERLSQQVEITIAIETLVEDNLVRRMTTDDGEQIELTETGTERAQAAYRDLAQTEITLVEEQNRREFSLSEVESEIGRSVVELAADCSDDGVYYHQEDAPTDDLIGRDNEREQFQRLIEDVQTTRQGEIVILSGPGGIGKTTLAETFFDEAPASVDILRTRCQEAGGEPYQPLRDALAQLGAEETFSTAAIEAEDADIYEAQQTALFHEITSVLEPSDGVRVLFLDDIDLADAATWTYLEYLAERISELPLVVLGTHRPDALPEETPLTADRLGQTPITRIELNALDRADTKRLIEQVLNRRGAPDPFVNAVHERTDGNPLFVETTVETLLERKQLDEQYQWYPDDAADIDLPGAVRETIVEQLGTLDDTTRELLEWAAVAGEAVPVQVLTETVDAPADRIRTIIETLVEAGTFIGDKRADTWRVTLRSNVVREALLQKLDEATLADRHMQIATQLESIVSLDESMAQKSHAEQAATIAYHLERGNDPEAAIEWYREAATLATEVYAHETATEHYHRVLDLARSAGLDETLLTAGHKLAEIYLTISDYEQASRYVQFVRERTTDDQLDYQRKSARLAAEIAIQRGSFQEAIEHAQEGLDLADMQDVEHCRLLAVKTEAEWRKSDYEEAEQTCEQFYELAKKLERTDLVAEANEQLAMIVQERSEYDRAIEYYQRALEKAQEVGDRHHQADIRNGLGIVANRLGNDDEAREYYEQALSTAEKIGDRHQAAKLYNNLAGIYGNAGNREKEREYFEKALETGQAIGDRDLTAVVRLNLATIFDQEGKYEKGREYLEDALDTWEAMGDDHSASIAMLNLGIKTIETGEFEKARDNLEEALTITRNVGDTLREGSILNALAWLLREEGRYEQASALIQKALDTVEEFENEVQIESIRANWAEIANVQEEYETARDRIETVLSTLRKHDEETLLGHNLLTHAEIEMRLGNDEQAAASLDEAREIIEADGDVHGLALVNKVSGMVARDRGEYQVAREYLNDALTTVTEIGARTDESRIRHELGKCERRAGNPDTARTNLEGAQQLFAEIGMLGDELKALESLCRLASEQGWHADGRDWCQRGIEIAHELDHDYADEKREWFEEIQHQFE